jgi:hypothetical protein
MTQLIKQMKLSTFGCAFRQLEILRLSITTRGTLQLVKLLYNFDLDKIQ